MKLEVLHVPDCPNLSPLLKRLAEVTDLPVTTHVIDSDADAARFRHGRITHAADRRHRPVHRARPV